MNDGARILTLLVQTSQEIWTIFVIPTLGFLFGLTADVWISTEVRRTPADRQVISHLTRRSMRTLIVLDTRIDTLRVDTGMIARTVAVAVAADHLTSVLRTTMETVFAPAVGHVIADEAFGISSANVGEQTGIHAIVVDA